MKFFTLTIGLGLAAIVFHFTQSYLWTGVTLVIWGVLDLVRFKTA